MSDVVVDGSVEPVRYNNEHQETLPQNLHIIDIVYFTIGELVTSTLT